MNQIWILEDDLHAHFLFRESLSKDFQLHFFTNLTELDQALKLGRPDVLVADLILPGEHFLDYYKTHNEAFRNINILIVSSLDDMSTIDHSFHLGVVDYITKPFNANELLFKVAKIAGSPISSDDVTFNDILFTVTHSDRGSVQLTPKEYQIFKLIYNSPEKSADKNAIQKVCWQSKITSPNTIDVHLYNLRRKIQTLNLVLDYLPPKTYRILRDATGSDVVGS